MVRFLGQVHWIVVLYFRFSFYESENFERITGTSRMYACMNVGPSVVYVCMHEYGPKCCVCMHA
jgi:hypothetical protein